MSPLQVGTSFRDITPHYPAWAHGYYARTRKSSGVREPLSLGCLAMGNGETKILIITLDMIGINIGVCEELLALLEKNTGVAFPNIMITASHTHFAPALHATIFSDPKIAYVEPDPQYVSDVKANLVDAARQSLADMRPTRLESVRAQAPGVLFNRRTRKADGQVKTNYLYPPDPDQYVFGPVDPEITALRFVDDEGVRAVLVNFGCHPVTGCSPAKDDYKFSSDYPHYLRKTISDAWHCPVFFTLGAAGDAVPIKRHEDSRTRIGNVLGNTVVLAERAFTPDTRDTLEADVVELEAETILKTSPSVARAEYEDARRRIAALEEPEEDREPGDAYRRAGEAFRRKMTAYVRSRLYPDNKAVLNAQFVRIGGTVLVGLPFEVLSEISMKMKERFPNSVLVSCAGGYEGYLPLAYEYERGGYEATEASTHFVPGTGDRILKIILNKLGETTSSKDA